MAVLALWIISNCYLYETKYYYEFLSLGSHFPEPYWVNVLILLLKLSN